MFLDASTHLYKRVCPSVGPSVRGSVGPWVRNAFFFISRKWLKMIRINQKSHQNNFQTLLQSFFPNLSFTITFFNLYKISDASLYPPVLIYILQTLYIYFRLLQKVPEGTTMRPNFCKDWKKILWKKDFERKIVKVRLWKKDCESCDINCRIRTSHTHIAASLLFEFCTHPISPKSPPLHCLCIYHLFETSLHQGAFGPLQW